MSVHLAWNPCSGSPEYVFTMLWNRCSPSNGIRVHDAPEYPVPRGGCVNSSRTGEACLGFPLCQGAAGAAWLQAREREVLDVEYFHVVFTRPHELAPLALQNRRAVYGMDVVPCRFRNPTDAQPGPETTGCGDRLSRAPAHLGTEPPCPSAPALRDFGWRHQLRRRAMGPWSRRILSTRSRLEPNVPR